MHFLIDYCLMIVAICAELVSDVHVLGCSFMRGLVSELSQTLFSLDKSQHESSDCKCCITPLFMEALTQEKRRWALLLTSFFFSFSYNIHKW